VRKEFLPETVMRQQARVQHVGRGDQHLGRVVAQRAPLCRGGVAVVDGDAQVDAAGRADVGLERAALILRQRLERKNVQSARARIGQRRAQRRECIDERLAARGRRRQHDVAIVVERCERTRLVAVERGDAASREHGREMRVRGRQRRRTTRVLRGQVLAVRERARESAASVSRCARKSARGVATACSHPEAHRGASGDDPHGGGPRGRSLNLGGVTRLS
jgi:hypothetical protein